MTADRPDWAYALAPDVLIEPDNTGVVLRTATNHFYVEDSGYSLLVNVLKGDGSTAAQLAAALQRARLDAATTSWEALLFRLDRHGLLLRRLVDRGRNLLSCVPHRPPPPQPPKRISDRVLSLAPEAIARAEGGEICLEVPGAWARIILHDRMMLPLLHDLAIGRSARQIAAAATTSGPETIFEALSIMDHCGLLGRGGHDGWSAHDLLFHVRTRRGYARALLGKTAANDSRATATPDTVIRQGPPLMLRPPVLAQLLANDPPYALVSERRRSIRRQGSRPLTSDQLSEFLFRTLHERSGRRPYPSGGSCYPLRAYLAVDRCIGLAPGLYAYDPQLHALAAIGEAGSGADQLLTDAAGTAGVTDRPQILLVLAARYQTTRHVYGDLSYSLILKEVGAVFQAAMMASAAMGIGSCALGCGDSIEFSGLLGLDPRVETSVGELILGSLKNSA
jgi:oxazoline/thiazoline dehydrogenase